MAGTKISDATLRSSLKGSENLPIVDTDLPVGRTQVSHLKTFIQNGMLTKSQADGYYQPKGAYLTSVPPEYVTETELDGKGYATTSAMNSALGAKLNTSTYNSEKATFATKTELSAKVGGTGVTSIKVVNALPDPQEQGVLYIVTGEEA